MFGDNNRLKLTFSIPGNFYDSFTVLTLNLLGQLPLRELPVLIAPLEPFTYPKRVHLPLKHLLINL